MENETILEPANTTSQETVGIKKYSEICPNCGDHNNFHMMLIKNGNVLPAETKFQLKCPGCSRTYDFNLQCEIEHS